MQRRSENKSSIPSSYISPGHISLLRCISASIFLIFLLAGCQSVRSLPEGISFQGEPHSAGKIQFLKDVTYLDKYGDRKVDQEIFPKIFKMIQESRRIIILDFFLFTGMGGVRSGIRSLSEELTTLLIEQKTKYPSIKIFVITDPFNTLYGGLRSNQFDRLRDAGISVTITDLVPLRDSNIIYSPFWRVFFKPLGNSERGWLPHPFGEGKITVRSYLRLFNFKANHRKVLIADSGPGFVGLITSANPHDASSAHGKHRPDIHRSGRMRSI